ncbi:hypothetical protein V1477_006396 [Vespula maculifrons]
MVVECATSPFKRPRSGSPRKKFLKENVFFFVPFKPLLLCSYWSALYAKNMCVEDATTSFKRPRSCSRRCYSFGEKKLLRNNFFFLCSL